jgi:penicillin-binding protein activator
MKMRNLFWSFLLICFFFVGGCAVPTEVVDTRNDQGPAVMGLDYRDFENAAATMVESMLASGAVNKPGGGRYVLAIPMVVNDTMQRIDTDLLTKKIRVELLNSGKVVTTTAVGLTGPEDAMSMRVRELRGSKEFDQSRIAGEGQMIAPDLSLSGKIIQRNISIDRRRQQVEYYFLLSLTDSRTGLALWEGEKPIIKRGSNKSVAW